MGGGLGFEQSLCPLQISPPFGHAGHPRFCASLYRDRVLKIQAAPKHAIETAKLFCLLDDVINI
jgi:hypothetical protein